MKIKILVIILNLSICSFAQKTFDKAYFITNFDERVECFIRNKGWKSNPISFDYKLSVNGEIKENNISNVKAFEIYNDVKYVRSLVKIDESSEDLNRLSNTRTPEFKERQVFLRELIKGKISLYRYTEESMTRFFYQIENNEILQLIYKPYEIEEGKIAYNEDYKEQLESILSCQSIKSNDIRVLKYKEANINDLFIKYYICSDSNFVEKQTDSKNKGKFNVYIRPRINFSSAQTKLINLPFSFDLQKKVNFGFGIELEYVLPFNKNEWAIITEPTYQSYKSDKELDTDLISGGSLTSNLDYKSIELPIGLRRYLHFNNKSKLFVNTQICLNFPMNSTLNFTRKDNSVYIEADIKVKPNFVFGIGYKYNKYGVEARFYTNKKLTQHVFNYINTDYKNISLLLSYSLF